MDILIAVDFFFFSPTAAAASAEGDAAAVESVFSLHFRERPQDDASHHFVMSCDILPIKQRVTSRSHLPLKR
jgi:hypothetical protein